MTEEEISRAVFSMIQGHAKLAEGAAGCSLGALLKVCRPFSSLVFVILVTFLVYTISKRKEEFRGRVVVVVVCGGNLGVDYLRRILSENEASV